MVSIKFFFLKKKLNQNSNNKLSIKFTGSDTIYVSGLFNGLSSKDPSHRARIPSPIAISITDSIPYASGLDFIEATFKRRHLIDIPDNGALQVEQRFYFFRKKKLENFISKIFFIRWFAPRDTLTSLIVHEIDISAPLITKDATIYFNVNIGNPSNDITFCNFFIFISGCFSASSIQEKKKK